MKRILLILMILWTLPVSAKSFTVDDYMNEGFDGYMGEYFLNEKPKTLGAAIGKDGDVIYLLERNYDTSSHIMYICNLLNKTDNTLLLQCLDPANKELFIKLKMDYLSNAYKAENQEYDGDKDAKIIYVSIGDNKDCIEKYNSPASFEKYCNPKTNKNITYLKLYNLYTPKD